VIAPVFLLYLQAPAAAAPASQPPLPPTATADPRARQAEIRAAIDGGRLVQADLMLGALPDAPSIDELRLFGDLRLAQQRYVDAAKLFLKLEQLTPQDAHAISRLGMALLHLDRLDDAEARLRKAVALPGADWQSWNVLGVLLDGRRAWIESRQAYAQALALAPNEPKVLNNAAYSLILQDHAGEAREMLAKAHALAPADPRITVNIEIADGMAGFYPKKRAANETNAQWAAHLNNAGYGAMLAGDLPKARSLFARAIEASNTHYDAAEKNLARVESQLGR
jgi:Flp pilus assembly protein TadD